MSELGLKIVVNNVEKDLDDIFLKITDYNSSSEYQADEAVVLTQETGIKYIENGVKKDLIDRYIGYDSDGYIAANYEADLNRIDASNLNAITDINGNNLVNLFYQLGTKKVSSNEYKSYIIHNKNKRVDFEMKFNDNINLNILSMNSNDQNYVKVKYNNIEIIYIVDIQVYIDTSYIDTSQNVVDIKENYIISDFSSTQHKFYIEDDEVLNVNLDAGANFHFNKDTVKFPLIDSL